MTITQIAKQYSIPLETAARMQRDGVLLTELLTTEQVAKRFQTKPETIHKLVRDGELPVKRLKGSRLLRFDPREIEVSTRPASNVLEMKR